MDTEKYIPNPIDTSDIVLSPDLQLLAEVMAKNVHEVWAFNRMKEGWQFGYNRDDEHKLNPCLVPYEDLSEEEKAYDRNTAMETLKLIIRLGFKISVAPEE